jgi:hypothetical protein
MDGIEELRSFVSDRAALNFRQRDIASSPIAGKRAAARSATDNPDIAETGFAMGEGCRRVSMLGRSAQALDQELGRPRQRLKSAGADHELAVGPAVADSDN